MDPVKNPFAPGAGAVPPELAGRDEIIASADIALQRIGHGRYAKSQILLGLRGTGKTVLLNRIEALAESHNHQTSFIEAPDKRKLAELLYPKLFRTLQRFSLVENAKAKVHEGQRALRSFASVFKVSMGDFSLSVEPEPGIADSGNLEIDLPELFLRVGQAAQAAGRAWTLLIDEVQYLPEDALAALIVAMHRASQKQLPVVFFGAGLPQIAALSGNAKSYAERLFDFPPVEALDKAAAFDAIKQPVEKAGEAIEDEALERIFRHTKGYPFFLQEWGYQSWDAAQESPICANDVERGSKNAVRRLDEGFFRVRYERLTPKEKDYIVAMATLGKGPYRSSDVAEQLGQNNRELGPCRASIIHKGMIYSPAHGDIAFTVPLFEAFIKRTAGI